MVVFSLTLVRHGETVANKDGIIQGHQDVALSQTGQTQARLVAFRLRNEKFTHIFASDLSRAAQTAQMIVEGSTVSQCTRLQKDPRLRERKFGVYEGKTFAELNAAAKASNKQWSDFTPEGAETYAEVRFRARAFFRELCEKMAAASTENTYIPTPVQNTPNVNVDVKTNRAAGVSAAAPPEQVVSSEGKDASKGAMTVQAASTHPQSAEEAIAAKRPRTEEPQLDRLSLEGRAPSSSVDADCAFSEGQGAGATTMARSNSSSSSGCSSLHDSVECPEADGDLPTPTEEERDTDSSDVGISQAKQDPNTPPACPSKNAGSGSGRSLEQNATESKWCSFAGQAAINWLWDGLQPWVRDTDPSVMSSVDPSNQTCPNVSLSPLLEHRLTSMSSVSSGRNSSFDDADIVPSVVGEVLVVTHGGLIKELVTHFIEDLNCKVPGGKGHALRVCPNTGVSRFMVTLSEVSLPPTVTCLLIHDKEHLKAWQEPLPCQYTC